MNTQINTRNIVLHDQTQGVARVKGQTHRVEQRAGKWISTFTHVKGCGCNYCSGSYDWLLAKK